MLYLFKRLIYRTPLKEWLKQIRFFRMRLRLYGLYGKRIFLRRPSKTPAPITVCIPAYQSGEFLLKAIESLQKQTLLPSKILISIDGNDTKTLDACRPFMELPQIEIVLQEKRLGWIKNTNFLLKTAATPFLSILPHDDLLHPCYLEELYQHLSMHPQCDLVYCDTESFADGRKQQRFDLVHP